MPIYAYRCAACGHAQDVLQKISDPLLTVCPSCGAAEFKKQLTAAGFQLKGSGWYVTDFRNGSAKPDANKPAAASTDTPSTDKPADAAGPAKAEAASAPAPAPAATPPAPSSGGAGKPDTKAAPIGGRNGRHGCL